MFFQRTCRKFLAIFGCHLLRVQREPDTAQIKAVRIVAGVNGRVVAAAFMRVVRAGMVKFLESFIIEFEELCLTALHCKFSTALAMVSVIAVIEAFAVVENGEKANHGNVGTRARGKQEPVELHLVPMLYAMDLRFEGPILKGIVHQRSEVNHFP